MNPADSAPSGLIDLAAARVGGVALLANDEFFAEKENLLKPGRGIFVADKYTDRGKWMDGWETRRRFVSQPSPIFSERPGMIRLFIELKNMSLQARGTPPFSIAARSTSSPVFSLLQSGTTIP